VARPPCISIISTSSKRSGEDPPLSGAKPSCILIVLLATLAREGLDGRVYGHSIGSSREEANPGFDVETRVGTVKLIRRLTRGVSDG